MVSKVEYVLIDDIDGSPAVDTVIFSLDGTQYEIDLNDEHAAQLREAMSPFVAKGREVRPAATRNRRGASRSAAPKAPSEMALARAWAREQAIPVSQRGKLPAHVLEAYRAAQSG